MVTGEAPVDGPYIPHRYPVHVSPSGTRYLAAPGSVLVQVCLPPVPGTWLLLAVSQSRCLPPRSPGPLSLPVVTGRWKLSRTRPGFRVACTARGFGKCDHRSDHGILLTALMIYYIFHCSTEKNLILISIYSSWRLILVRGTTFLRAAQDGKNTIPWRICLLARNHQRLSEKTLG